MTMQGTRIISIVHPRKIQQVLNMWGKWPMPKVAPRTCGCSTTLESIFKHLQGIQDNLDILREHRYEDRNEFVAYMNDIQLS